MNAWYALGTLALGLTGPWATKLQRKWRPKAPVGTMIGVSDLPVRPSGERHRVLGGTLALIGSVLVLGGIALLIVNFVSGATRSGMASAFLGGLLIALVVALLGLFFTTAGIGLIRPHGVEKVEGFRMDIATTASISVIADALHEVFVDANYTRNQQDWAPSGGSATFLSSQRFLRPRLLASVTIACSAAEMHLNMKIERWDAADYWEPGYVRGQGSRLLDALAKRFVGH